MRHASLFSGIGGFDLAAEWMGWENVFQVEIDKFCTKVLEKNFPNVKRYGDIKEFDGTKYRGAIDILTGGFPCQDISIANPNGKGLSGKRSGLWFEMFRVCSEIRPRWIIVENVTNVKKMAYERIKSDLESIGYQVEPFDISAASCGLPTMERHIWIIATTNSQRCEGEQQQKIHGIKTLTREFQGGNTRELNGWTIPAARLCGVGERIPNRMDRLKALGNSIVPQVVFEIFKAIEFVTE